MKLPVFPSLIICISFRSSVTSATMPPVRITASGCPIADNCTFPDATCTIAVPARLSSTVKTVPNTLTLESFPSTVNGRSLLCLTENETFPSMCTLRMELR